MRGMFSGATMTIIKKQFIFLMLLIGGLLLPPVSYTQEAAVSSETKPDSLPEPVQSKADTSLLEKMVRKELKTQLVKRDSIEKELGPFRVSVGASFNFIEGLKANDVYADVSIFLPHMWTLSTKRDTVAKKDTMTTSLGIDFGFSQGRSFLIDSTETDVISKETTNLSLYGDIVCSTKKLPFLYFLVHTEVRRRDFTTETQMDTLITKLSTRLTEGYFGGGFILHYDIGEVELKVKTVLGLRVASKGQGQGGFTYLIQYKLVEKDFGIKLGGEIRGIKLDEPEILIYLAKEFPLKKITDFLK